MLILLKKHPRQVIKEDFNRKQTPISSLGRNGCRFVDKSSEDGLLKGGLLKSEG